MKEIMKKTVGIAKKVGDQGFQDKDLGEIQVLIDTTPEELTENIQMEMCALESVPDDEEEDLETAVSGITDIRQIGRSTPIIQDHF